jgi:hypothetical protein
MSTTRDLEDSVGVLADLGLINRDELDTVEHCVDDAVNALSNLTGFLKENKDIADLIRNRVTEKNMEKYNNPLLYIKTKDVSELVLPHEKNLEVIVSGRSDSVQDVYVKTDYIDKFCVGVCFQGDIYININSADYLNNAHKILKSLK